VTMAACKKELHPASLDDRNVGPLGWKNYSKPPATNMTFPGPFTDSQTQVNDTMAKLDFNSGQLLVSMDFKSKGTGAPSGTLLYMGGNATCLGLAVFVKGTKLGFGNTCSSGMETEVEMGIQANKWHNVKVTYQWGKVNIYSGASLKKHTVKHFVLPKKGKITIGASGHDNGRGKFTFGEIKNVLIKSEASEFVQDTPVQHAFYNCSDIPCRGTWVAKKQTCALKGYCDDDIPCPDKHDCTKNTCTAQPIVTAPAAVPVTSFEDDDDLAELSFDSTSDYEESALGR